MRTSPFGANGPDVPVIGQGTWYIEMADHGDAVAALQQGIDRGLTHIDTAEMYGDGRAEQIVGDAIRGRRDEVFLVSKVLPWNASYTGTITACEMSLERLGTDHLDAFLLHWRGSQPLEETFGAMQKLVESGKIRQFGVSNFDADDLEEALALTGPGALACNQVLYHLEERAADHRVIPWCRENGVAFVAYSPFGHDGSPRASRAGKGILARIAQKHDASAWQVALAFLTREPGLFAIPKAVQPAHVDDNANAGTLDLTPEEIMAIDAAFPKGPPKSHLPML